jgi:FKBP-type peptidyl-prolyl cis-trans isomerase
MPIESLSLLAAVFFFPGVESFAPMDVGFDASGLVVDEQVGQGPELQEGSLATFHYEIADLSGKVLADSARRGLPYTARVEGERRESALLLAMRGTRVGGVRRILTDSDALAFGGDFLIPRATPLEVRVRVLGVSRAAATPGVD